MKWVKKGWMEMDDVRDLVDDIKNNFPIYKDSKAVFTALEGYENLKVKKVKVTIEVTD